MQIEEDDPIPLRECSLTSFEFYPFSTALTLKGSRKAFRLPFRVFIEPTGPRGTERALPTEAKVESGRSQSRNGTSK
jgi:hypothetical protein